jgi:hypothetical protein
VVWSTTSACVSVSSNSYVRPLTPDSAPKLGTPYLKTSNHSYGVLHRAIRWIQLLRWGGGGRRDPAGRGGAVGGGGGLTSGSPRRRGVTWFCIRRLFQPSL